ncbi:MAG: serine/threonine protein kinase [Planctomycetia bacterium]|nr:serine/threonine protein kinase [Planctomycetia bacterium]
MNAPVATVGPYSILGGFPAAEPNAFLAEHRQDGRRVVLRHVPSGNLAHPGTLERFRRITDAAIRLNRCNIVRLHQVAHENGHYNAAIEYVDGPNLQEFVSMHGALPAWEAARIIREAALALQHVHEAGLDHGDLKPGKLLLERSGAVKLLGVALPRYLTDEEALLTRQYDEAVLGTADYLSPECVLDADPPDIRRDIYSLGGVFYFCLTGRPPFAEGSVAQKLIWHQTRQPLPVTDFRPEVPRGLLPILDRMLAKNRAQRYQTPLEIVRALDQCQARGGQPEPRASLGGLLDRWFRHMTPPEVPAEREDKAHWLLPALWPQTGPWSATVLELVQALRRGEDCQYALHDALIDQGHAELAVHFNRASGGHDQTCCVLRAFQASD